MEEVVLLTVWPCTADSVGEVEQVESRWAWPCVVVVSGSRGTACAEDKGIEMEEGQSFGAATAPSLLLYACPTIDTLFDCRARLARLLAESAIQPA